MNKLEGIKIKISSLYIFSQVDRTELISIVEKYNDNQLSLLDLKLDIILKKLGTLTLKLIEKEKIENNIINKNIFMNMDI
ncbi:MAG: hypothetical protein V3575_03565 [Candidatus Absconditabacteria bacterium]